MEAISMKSYSAEKSASILPVGAKQKSICYLIEEKQPQVAYSFFRRSVEYGAKGICISRNPISKLRDKYDLPETASMWLSNIPSTQATSPKSLEKIMMAINDFISKDEGSLVLIDCLEYMITNNNFVTILKFMQEIRDKVILNKAIMLVSVDPATLSPQDISRLKNEFDGIF